MLFPSELNDRLLSNLDARKPSLGCFVFSHPNLAEVAGVAGIDVVIADMMFTTLIPLAAIANFFSSKDPHED